MQEIDSLIEIARENKDPSYDKLVRLLGRLTVGQLKEISRVVGISFDEATRLDVEDYINVLDETTWRGISSAYEQVIGHPFPIESILGHL